MIVAGVKQRGCRIVVIGIGRKKILAILPKSQKLPAFVIQEEIPRVVCKTSCRGKVNLVSWA